jgi:hypothetical protein
MAMTSPVSRVTSRVPPERVTFSLKLTVTLIIAPMPYVPSAVAEVMDVI